MMYLSSILLILIFTVSLSSTSICSENYSSCECEETTSHGQYSISLKCSTIPKFLSNINYRTIEFDSCLEDLNFEKKFLANLHLNILRIRHCNLIHVNDQSFAQLHQLEKFSLENSTIKSLSTSNGNFQEIFADKSFQTLKSLTLKSIHYHQSHSHDKKLNLEYLLQQLPRLYRLELSHIYLDNYRHSHLQSIGEDLTYLSLTNTHQTSLLPIESFRSLERLLIRQLPEVFHTQPLISSLGKLHHLKYILFEHNQLKTIEHLQSDSIDDIDLSSNLIESIDGYTFEHVPKLRQLTLTGNPLNSIDKNAFCGIESLQRLSIHIKHRTISPLDNCILINYPHLQIIQDSQTKFPCNCELHHVYEQKRQPSTEINRLFKLNQVCLAKDEQMMNLYELEKTFNCSSNNQCQYLCQKRETKLRPIINPKYFTSSLSSKLRYEIGIYLSVFVVLGF